MKICNKCKVEKSLDRFGNRKRASDGKASLCLECKRAQDNLYYRQNDERKRQIKEGNARRIHMGASFVREYLGGHPCVDCGLSDPELLEFDHVRDNKVAGVGRMVQTAQSLNAIKKEIEKCEVRCLHCHRKRTIKALGWYKTLTEV